MRMRAVTLVYLPGSNYLIGTFDPACTTDWWVSSGFTNVETVEKGFHVLGSIHGAICKKTDGTWSMFKSDDYAQSWYEVLNIAYRIYDAVIILPGRIIINTANGFYESTTSGNTWTLVLGLPTAPDAAAICNAGNGDVLFCTDGRYIYKSLDLARSWTMVCDQQNISGRHFGIFNGGETAGYRWIGSPTYAAIAGANGVILAAHGPFLTMSADLGTTWARTYSWDCYHDAYAYHGFAPHSLVYSRFPTTSTEIAHFAIKQILISRTDGPYPWDVHFAVRYDDLDVASGNSYCYSRLFIGHEETASEDDHARSGPSWWYVLGNIASPADNLNQISAYELPLSANADHTERVLFSAQAKMVNGVLTPSLATSIDGGYNWTKVDLTLVDFELPSDSGIAISDETFIQTSWSWGSCTNTSWYNVTGSPHWRRLQSYDMDWIMKPYETVEETYDMRVKIEPPAIIEVEYDMGLYALGRHLVPMLHDSLIEVTNEKQYKQLLIIEINRQKDFDHDLIVEVDREVSHEMSLWLERRVYKPYVMSYDTEVNSTASYGMGAFFAKVTVPDIDWASPQWWNILFPDTTKAPLNSRGGY